ncbi:MAG: shikimate dehydrogenase family protein [Candidatus Eremiobacter antarcticus]|nr:shikimate dehydrogenase [Candidatus Eremiobacteraeota bacterium]MBC5808905.1 shikimate dehydrogenase [Candidatus Eremiobacteraeota bacterium]
MRYALIGSPVAHSRSPALQLAAFSACGPPAVYEAIDVPVAGLGDAIARLRRDTYKGWNVTTPLKEAVIAHLDRLTQVAASDRAVNVVRREPDGSLTGHNTDGAGLVQALADVWSWEPRHKSALVLGSGPAARAIASALRMHGIGFLYCWSRNAAAAALIGPLPLSKDTAPMATDLESVDAARVVKVDLIVSALPADASLPAWIAAVADEHSSVFDLNYDADRSPVGGLRAARRSDGVPLLLHQGALSFAWWTGLPQPLDVMRSALGL